MFHIGMAPAQVQDLPDDLAIFEDGWRAIQEIFEWPDITEEEIEQMEIPEGQMYVPFRGHMGGSPVCGRFVRGREGNSIAIDVRYNTARLERLQRILEQRLGCWHMMENIDA